MTQPQETEMDRRKDTSARLDSLEDIIELGAVSTETKGIGLGTEIITDGDVPIAGISDE